MQELQLQQQHQPVFQKLYINPAQHDAQLKVTRGLDKEDEYDVDAGVAYANTLSGSYSGRI